MILESTTVELVQHTYQPTKAEMNGTESELNSKIREGATMEQLGKFLMQSIIIRWINRPRKRRRWPHTSAEMHAMFALVILEFLVPGFWQPIPLIIFSLARYARG